MQELTQSLLDALVARAVDAPRRRAHHALHAGDHDPVQRFVVAGTHDSYFRPHRHLAKSELSILVRGSMDVVTFDDAGTVLARRRYGAGADGFAWETPAGTWHTLVPDRDGAFAFVEVKEGPYDRATAVDYAPWAPVEGTVEAGHMLTWLRVAQPGERFTPAG